MPVSGRGWCGYVCDDLAISWCDGGRSAALLAQTPYNLRQTYKNLLGQPATSETEVIGNLPKVWYPILRLAPTLGWGLSLDVRISIHPS